MEFLNNFFLIAILLAAVFLLLLVAMGIRTLMRRGETEIGGWMIRGSPRRVSAVIGATLAEGLRMRMAAAFVIAVIVSMPLVAIYGTGDGTIKGRVEMFLSYCAGLTSFLLAMLTVVLASWSLSAEIKGRQIFGLLSKPIPRWQVIAGKWCGVMLLNAALVAFSSVAAYGGVRYILWTFHREMHAELTNRGGLSDEQAAKCLDAISSVRGAGGMGVESPIIPAVAEALGWTNQQVVDLLLRLPEPTRANLRRLDQLRRQVLVARASLRPPEPDVSGLVEARFKELAAANQLPIEPDGSVREPAQVKAELAKDYFLRSRMVPPMYQPDRAQWTLQGPPPLEGSKFLMSVRYKLDGYAPEMRMMDGTALEEETLVGRWCVGDPFGPSGYFWPDPLTPQALNTVVEFEVPHRAIGRDGRVQLWFANIDPRGLAAVFAKDGIEVLYTAGTFEGNLFRGAVAQLLPLMLLTAMGVFFSTFCTFPVAALVTLSIYAVGSATEFIQDSLNLTESTYAQEPTTLDRIRKSVGEGLLDVMSMGGLNVSQNLVEGRLNGWSEIGKEAFLTVLLKGGLFLGLAVVVFRRRELAAVIV